MTTALLIFLGMSCCATLFLVAAFTLNARMSQGVVQPNDAGALETDEGRAQTPSMVPSFSH